MKKVLMGGLLFALLFFIFSCSGPVKSKAVDVVVTLKGLESGIEKLELSVLQGGKVYLKQDLEKVEEQLNLKLEPGDYELIVRALSSKEPLAEGKTVLKVSDNVKILNTTVYLQRLSVSTEADFLDSAKKFKVSYVITDSVNKKGELRFEFVPEAGKKYYIYALRDKIWVPLYENIDQIPQPMQVNDGEIKLFGDKTLNINDIELYGIEVRSSGKSSGIAPVVLFSGEKTTNGRVRSVPASLDATHVAICSDDGNLYILDHKDGLKEKVKYSVRSKGLMSPVIETISTSGDKTHIFVAGEDGAVYNFVWSNSELTLLKRAFTDGSRIEAAPIVLNDTLYVLTYSGKIFAFTDLATSLTLAASRTIVGAEKLITSPVADSEYIYFNFTRFNSATNKAELYIGRAKLAGSAIEFSQKKIADVDNPYSDVLGKAATASSPIILNDYLYFGTVDGKVFKIHKQYFDYDIESLKSYKDLKLGRIDTSMVASGSNFYLGTDDGYIVKLNHSLDVEWSYYTGRDVKGIKDAVRSTPVLGNDDTLYVGTYEGYIYALDVNDGKVKWRYQVDERIWGSPIIVDSKLIIGANDNKIYSFKVSSNGMGGEWSKWRKNGKNSGN